MLAINEINARSLIARGNCGMSRKLLITILLVSLSLQSTTGVHWIALSKWKRPWNESALCLQAKKFAGLRGRQVSLCQKHVEVMPHIVTASRDAVSVCTRVFYDRRWNCSSVRTAPFLTADLVKGTREQAYVYALSSASIAYSIAKACSDGSLQTCGCGPLPHEPPHGDFKWGGCAHNIKYGLKFTRNFADAPWRQKSVRKSVLAALNRHNNQAGRRAVRSSLQTECKCHGVSGSCNIKTCWRALPRLPVIGEKLKRRYYVATEVVLRQFGSRKKLVTANSKINMFQKNDLIYVSKSPDYCLKDEKVGSPGTHGRSCNATSQGTDGCDSMCCGRGYRTYSKEKLDRCHCKYYWCCYVKCKTCRSWVESNVCK